MSAFIEGLFLAVAASAFVGVPLYAWRQRGRSYAIFAAVILGFSLPGAIASEILIASRVPEPARFWVVAFFAYSVTAAGLHLAHLVRARLRSSAYRWLVSVPGQVFIAAGFIAGFWQLALLPVRGLCLLAGVEAMPSWFAWVDALPFALGIASIVTSWRPRVEWVRFALGGDGADEFHRVRFERSRHPSVSNASDESEASRPLRIVQISDPHLGPWQPVAKLRNTLETLVAKDPDLILLTGDFLTMESQGTPGALAEALEPLRAVSDRCYAIFGNHDHEAPDEVRSGLAAQGIRLLVDDEAVAETPLGPVQLIGADYVRAERREHLTGLFARFPRREGIPRLLLLHDPIGFQHVPPGEIDLTLSGHTHGGQVGLVSFGLDWTVLSRSAWPDHGLFAQGASYLYVHRGTGFYGFPLRIGVPGELSVLELSLS